MFITIANYDYQYTYIPCTHDTVKIRELLFFYVSSDVICKEKYAESNICESTIDKSKADSKSVRFITAHSLYNCK